jgi:hypothetical protein
MYRIVEHPVYKRGEFDHCYYVVQKRFLGLFWRDLNLTDYIRKEDAGRFARQAVGLFGWRNGIIFFNKSTAELFLSRYIRHERLKETLKENAKFYYDDSGAELKK